MIPGKKLYKFKGEQLWTKLPKLKNKSKLNYIFVLVIISYLAQAFFNISTIGVAPLFWMILGLSDNQYIDRNCLKQKNIRNNK